MSKQCPNDVTVKSSGASRLYVRQLGTHHFAYMRALVQGMDVQSAARRYLGIEHGHEAVTAHRRVVDHLRGVARRRGDKAWRLVGVVIEAMPASEQPSLEDWAESQGLDGWSQAELQEMYAEAFPPDRKLQRNARLRARQLQLLKELQDFAARAPQPTDPISGWFDELTAERLKRAGLLMLGELQARVAQGGRWWSAIPAIGEGKAHRIEGYLTSLMGAQGQPPAPPKFSRAANQMVGNPADFVAPQPPSSTSLATRAALPAHALDGTAGVNRAPATAASTTAKNDREAIERWIEARAGSAATAKAYRKEAERLLLWCLTEHRKPLSSMILEDCLAYMAFLENIPPEWISRRRAARFEEGWAPFSKQLDHGSRKHAIIVLGGFFDWLVKAGYLQANPWTLVNRKTGDDDAKNVLDTRAFTPEAWAAIRAFLDAQPPSPALARTRFLMDFGEATGLRASEFLAAKLADFKPFRGRLALQVHGKGSRNRVVAVPGQALDALELYLQYRGLPPLREAPGNVPLVSRATDPMEPVTYVSLYQSTKRWFAKSISASSLSLSERMEAYRASLHWLRHTCGTRALERGAPLQLVQGQLGHADPRTTMRYAKTQLEQLMDGMDKVFGTE